MSNPEDPPETEGVTRWTPLAPAADAIGWNLPDCPSPGEKRGKRRKRKKKTRSPSLPEIVTDFPVNRDELPQKSPCKRKNPSVASPEPTSCLQVEDRKPSTSNSTDNNIEKIDVCLPKGYTWDESQKILTIEREDSRDQCLFIVGEAFIKLLRGGLYLSGYKVPVGSEVSINFPKWNNSIIRISSVGETTLQIKSTSHKGKATFEFCLQHEGNPITIFDSWKSSCDRLVSFRNKDQSSRNKQNLSSRILICGGKSVGKSSLLRYLSNRFLSNQVSVAVLDCDVGQPEFSPPGMLTLTLVDSPLLSPPFLHMRKNHLESFFFGSNTSRDDPTTYLELITDLFNSYLIYLENHFSGDETKLPLIVNTDGWIKGFGFEILTTIIERIKPTHVFNLTNSAVTNSRTLDLSLPDMSTLFSVQGFTATGTGINAHVLRSIRLCAYFLDDTDIWHRVTADSMGIIDTAYEIANTLARMKPYVVSSESVCCGTETSQFVGNEVLNGSIIGLIEKKNERMHCLGLGIVRGIQGPFLYVLTPIPREELLKVTNITKSAIQLPVECLYRGPHTDVFPYMCCRTRVVAAGGQSMSSRNNIGRKHTNNV